MRRCIYGCPRWDEGSAVLPRPSVVGHILDATMSLAGALLVRDPCCGYSLCRQADLYRLPQIRTKGHHWRDIRIGLKSTDHATELRKQVESPWEAGSDTVQECVCERDTYYHAPEYVSKQ